MYTITNKVITDIINMAPIEDKIRETRLKLFGDHVKKKNVDAPVKRCERFSTPKERRGRERPKKRLNVVIRNGLKAVRLIDDMA